LDFLNNANTVVGIIGGSMGIIASAYGFITYVRSRASSAQKKQMIQIQASQTRSSSQTVSKSLSWMDWMLVLWTGFEDCIRAREGAGIITAVGIGFTVTMFLGMISSVTPGALIVLLVFGIFYALVLLCFYAYFVGRRVEKKIDEIN